MPTFTLLRRIAPLMLVLALTPLAPASHAEDITWSVGDEIMALGKDGTWYYGEVLETKGALYRVDFLGLYKEWVDGSRIRPRNAEEIQGVTSTGGAGSQPEGKPGDARVKAALVSLGLPTTTDGDGDFRLELPTSDGRTQLVWVISATEKWGSMEIREVWSPAFRTHGRLDMAMARRLLDDNNQKILGAWRTLGSGEKEIAVFAVQIEASASAKSLEDVLDLVKKVADDLEKEVHGTDEL